MSNRHTCPETLATQASAPTSVCRILFAVADHDPDVVRLIRGHALDEETVKLRCAVIFVAKLYTSATLEQIARAVNRDHSAVVRSIARAKHLWQSDPMFRHACDRATPAPHRPA